MIRSLGVIRFQNWWNAKIPPLLSYAYVIILAGSLDVTVSFKQIGLLLVWMIGAAAFGHYINDVFDLKDDLKAGKQNRTKFHSLPVKVGISLLLTAITLLPWIALPLNTWNKSLVIAHLLVFLLYSAPPVRLKERGVLSVIADAVYAHIIPGLVVVTTMWDFKTEDKGYLLLGLFALWQLIIGCRNILNHHIDDYPFDKRSNTVTTATIYGVNAVKQTVKRIFVPLELVIFIVLLSVLPLPFPWIAGGYILFVIYVFNREVNFLRMKLNDEVVKTGRYDFLSGIMLNEFYEKWLPVVVLIILGVQKPVFLVLLGLHMILFYQVMLSFVKDINYVYEIVYQFFKRAYFGIEKYIRHFHYSMVLDGFNRIGWGLKIAFHHTKWFIIKSAQRTYGFFIRTKNWIYWRLRIFFHHLYWDGKKFYHRQVKKAGWAIIKLYYRIEYWFWKTFYKPIKDRFAGKESTSSESGGESNS